MISDSPKNQIAESTQKKLLRMYQSFWKIYILSIAESTAENFLIFNEHDLMAKVWYFF